MMMWFRRQRRLQKTRPSSDETPNEQASAVHPLDQAKISADFDRLLDPYDHATSLTVEGQHGTGLLIDLGQFLANITELMERFQLDPAVPIGLPDIADEQALYALFQSGMAETAITHMASEAARILTNDYPGIFPEQINFSIIDTFDPREAFDIPDGQFQFEPLGVTRTVMRDHLDPSRAPSSFYGIDQQGPEAVSAIMLGSLFTFAFVSTGCRMHKQGT